MATAPTPYNSSNERLCIGSLGRFRHERCDPVYVHVDVSESIARADKSAQCEAAAETRGCSARSRCGTRGAHVRIDIDAADIAVEVRGRTPGSWLRAFPRIRAITGAYIPHKVPVTESQQRL